MTKAAATWFHGSRPRRSWIRRSIRPSARPYWRPMLRTAAPLLSLLFLLLLPSTARAADWEWRASGGAQIDSSTHGVFDLGARKGPPAIQLYTDTPELRYRPGDPEGRGSSAAPRA